MANYKKIQGKILDGNTQDPIWNAHIFEVTPGGERTPKTVSNENGNFEVENFNTSNKIGVSYLGYTFKKFNQNEDILNIFKADNLINEVEITASRKTDKSKFTFKYWYLIFILIFILIVIFKQK